MARYLSNEAVELHVIEKWPTRKNICPDFRLQTVFCFNCCDGELWPHLQSPPRCLRHLSVELEFGGHETSYDRRTEHPSDLKPHPIKQGPLCLIPQGRY